ncbi:MAG TPA: BACON domain-containing carbohydrate-binding protein [Blastocatellia bacterium]|nr:BACON domain-containing carbohydrate-binding protein [Blastocatellia bacterium]
MRFPQLPQRFVVNLVLAVLLGLAGYAGSWLLPLSARGQGSTISTVSAASYASALAPEAIAAGFGSKLAVNTVVATSQPLPTTLGGTTVRVNGVPAPLFFVSPNQINYLIPANTAPGNQPVMVTAGDGSVSTGTVQVGNVAPALFTADGSLPAATLLRVTASGQFISEPISQVVNNALVPKPIVLGPPGEVDFLILYGCGVRRAAAGEVKAMLAGNELTADFAAAPGFTGLDQINVGLQPYLSGRGRVSLQLKVGNALSNVVEFEMGGQDLRAATTTIVTSSANPVSPGQSVTFTARVSAASGTPSGTVVFKDNFNGNSQTLGSATLAGGVAGFSTASLAVGTHQIRAEYEGDNNYKPGSAALGSAQLVGKAQSVVTLSSSLNPSNRDQTVTLTAGVRTAQGGNVTPTGIVQFKENNAPLGTPMTLVNGSASIGVSTLSLGSRNLTAEYFGDPNFQGASSAAYTQTVTTAPLQIVSIVRQSPVYAGDEIQITGSGFTGNPADHEVKIVADDDTETTGQIMAAAADQLRVRIPFGAASGKIRVVVEGCRRVEGCRIESADRMEISTSVSGFVQEVKNGERLPVAGLPVTLIEQGGSHRIQTTTNDSGAFIVKGASPALRSTIQIGGQAANALNYEMPPFGIRVLGNRDNQLSRSESEAIIVELKPNGTSFTGPTRTGVPVNATLRAVQTAGPDAAAGVITAGQVSFDTNNSVVTCPGTPGCRLALGVFDAGRVPANLPAGVFSSTIAQITPSGATLAPGGKLTFPNSDGIPAGTTVQLFRFDQGAGSPTLGQFVEIGAATISSDGMKIETTANAVTQASYYFVSRRWLTAKVTGFVFDSARRPVPRAIVNLRGQAAFTDTRGSFVIADVPVLTANGLNDQATIEVSFVRPDGTVARAQQSGINLNANQETVTPDLLLPLKPGERQPTIIAPNSLLINEGETRDVLFVVSTSDNTGGKTLLNGPSFATLVQQGSEFKTIHLTPGNNSAGNYELVITAQGTAGATSTRRISLVVVRPGGQQPRANWAFVTTNEDTATAIPLTGVDPGGQTLNYRIVSPPAHGDLSGSAPNMLYTPHANYAGIDSFAFNVSNGGAESNVAVVSLVIRPVNDSPKLTVPEVLPITSTGQTFSFEVSATDPDEGQRLSFTAEGLPPGATFTQVSPTVWKVSWTPTIQQVGAYAITFMVSDDGLPPLTDTRSTTLTPGSQWQPARKIEGGNVYAMAAQDTKIFAATSNGIYLSRDNGQTWAAAGLQGSSYLAIAVRGADVIVGGYGSVYISNDEGRNWTRYTEGLPSRTVYSLAVSGTRLYAGFNGSGVYVSDDVNQLIVGQKWRELNDGLVYNDGTINLAKNVQVLAAGASTVYAGTYLGGVFALNSDGKSWREANNGLTNKNVGALVVSDGRVFAGTYGGGVFVSTNEGQSWNSPNQGLSGNSKNIRALLASGGNLYAGTLAGVYVSGDNGLNWRPLNGGLLHTSTRSLFGNSAVLIVGTVGGGFYRLNQSASQWVPSNSGFNGLYINALAFNSGALFAGTSGNGVYVSTDKGQTWMQAGLLGSYVSALAVMGNNVFAAGDGIVYRSGDDARTWTEANANLPVGYLVTALTVSGNKLFAGLYGSGVYVTANAGQSWAPANNGLMNKNVQALAAGNGYLYAGTYLGGVFVSSDDGQNWREAGNGLTNRDITVLLVVNGRVFAGTYGGGVFVSSDNGTNWTEANTGLSSLYVLSLATDGTNVFLTTGYSVYATSNNGNSWSLINTGLTGEYSPVLAANGAAVYLGGSGGAVSILPEFKQFRPTPWAKASGIEGGNITTLLALGNKLLAGAYGSGVYVSTDNGQNWRFSGSGLDTTQVEKLVSANGKVYAATRSGIYVSSDEGQTWARFGLRNSDVKSVAVSGTKIFATVWRDGVYVSEDDGKSWELIRIGLPVDGYLKTFVRSLAVKGGKVFVGTYGGSFAGIAGNFNGYFPCCSGAGVFVLNDDGKSWRVVNNGLPSLSVRELIVDGSTLIAGLDDGVGVFVSNDDGQSWTATNNAAFRPVFADVYSLVVNGSNWFAGTDAGVFVSSTRGASWDRYTAGLSDVFTQAVAAIGGSVIAGTKDGGIFVSGNLGQTWAQSNSGLAGGGIGVVLTRNGKIFAAGQSAGIIISSNNGQSWTPSNNGLTTKNIYSLIAGGNNLLAGTANGLFVSDDEGQHWMQVRNGLPNGSVLRLAVGGTRVFAGTSSGLFVSSDNGNNWSSLNVGVSNPYVYSLAASGTNVYAGASYYNAANQFKIGLLVSNDNGQNWRVAAGGFPENQIAYRLTASGNVAYAGLYLNVLYRSTDGGRNWVRADAGLPGVFLTALAANGNAVFVGTGNYGGDDFGVYASSNNGRNWRQISEGLTGSTVTSLALNGNRLFAGTVGGVFLLADNVQDWAEQNAGLKSRAINTVLVRGNSWFVGTVSSGVFRSTDRGQSWVEVNNRLPVSLGGLSVANVQSLVANGGYIFAGLFGGGVYRTSNDGAAWEEVNNGLANRYVNALKPHAGSLFAATDAGVFRSVDNGGNWEPTNLEVQRVVSLASIGNRLLAGTYGGGIFVTENQGEKWTSAGQTNNGLNNSKVIALSAGADGSTWFAGTDGGGIFRSTNGGQSWVAVNADLPPGLSVYAFAVSGAKLYAGSIYGVFVSEDNGARWKQINAGLLDIFVTSLGVSDNTLIAGTRIGGVFTSQIPGAGNCTYAIAPAGQSFAAAGGSGNVSITTQTNCEWTATSDASWIAFTSGTLGSGSGAVNYSVAANTSASQRTGTMTIAGQTFTVAQAAAAGCTYAVAPTSQSFIAGGGNGSAAVTAANGCAWTATSNAGFITITAGASGNGNGTVNFSVAANTATSPRTGTMTIAGQTFTVTQSAGGCAYSLSPTGRSHTVSGGTNTVTVNTTSGCTWTATTNDDWLTITAGLSGNGPGSVTYSVAANPSATPRSGRLTIAGLSFSVFQSGCVSLSPSSNYLQTSGGTGSLTVTADAGCTWTAMSSATSWLTLTGTTSGNSTGTVTYSVAANTGSAARQATINVNGNLFKVEQRGTGSACIPTAITPGQTINGDLSSNDCVSPSRAFFGTHYADRYTFSGTSGQRIAIAQNSTAIDSYVFLIGPDGAILYTDDDGGGARNSRIPSGSGFYRLPASGVYTIEATSYSSNQAGNYSLSLTVTCLDLSPVSQTFTGNGGSGNVTVAALSDCPWTATSSANWLTINNGNGNGNGNGTIGYSVSPNSTGSPRSATISVSGEAFSVSQSSDGSTLSTDDGGFETSIGYSSGGTGHYVNRLTPTGYPATLSAVSIYFSASSGVRVGDQISILAGANPNGADNISNVNLQAVTATVQSLGQFNVFTIPRLTITSGDFVIGFRMTYPAGIYPCSIDQTPPRLRRSYTSADGLNFRHIEDDNPSLTSNFGIRAVLTTPPPAGSGAGLTGEYYDNSDFTNLKLTRVDPVINYDWYVSPPAVGMESETFSVRWTGQIQAVESGNYTFVTKSDDGVRLWINNQLVIDNFGLHAETEDRSAPVTLSAGQRYNVRMEFFDNTNFAVARLLWIRPGQSALEVIPQSRLFAVAANPVPSLAGLNPSALTAGSPGFTLTVTGANFINGSIVRWNDIERTTAFVGSTQLTAQIPAGDLTNPGTASVTVFNPAPGGGVSGALNLTINPCSYAVQLSSQSFSAGGGNGSATVTTTGGCAWTATSNAGFITITSGASGAGNGTVGFSVAANAGAARTGTITVAGQNFTINQGAGSATIIVNSLADTAIAGDGQCTLREAISNANLPGQTTGSDCVAGTTVTTISFSVTGTIQLTGGLPSLNSDQTINGPGPNLLTVRRNTGGDYRIFTINSGKTVRISGLTIANGQTPSGQHGGGINNGGSLSLTNCVISGNTAVGAAGGGLYSAGGPLVIANSTISGNNAGRGGGGILNEKGALTMTACTISGNTAGSAGAAGIGPGGLWNSPQAGQSVTATLTNCTISGNTAFGNQTGGGIDNSSGDGDATVNLINCTIANNSITGNTDGGGIYSGKFGTGNANIRLVNTIIAGNSNPQTLADQGGVVASLGYNLVSDGSLSAATGDLLNANPRLATLGSYGGPTLTHLPLRNSPAINAGSNTDAPTTDQRGVARPFGGNADIGAVEVNISLGPLTLPGGTLGVAYNQTLTAGGGNPAYTFNLIAGALPNGLTLNAATGALSGAPTQTGTFDFTIKATDAGGFAGACNYAVTIIQACSYVLQPASQIFGANGGGGNVNVSGASGCAWTATSNAGFITITSGASGAGNGTVGFSVAANTTTSQRTGTMTIAGQTFTVTQSAAGCTYSLSPTGRSHSVSGGTDSVTVNTGSGCAWTAVSNAGWLTITAGASGNGSGTVNYSVAANPGTSSRAGTLTIAGQTFNVFQSGCVSFGSFNPRFGTTGGTDSLTILSAAGCAWTATSSATWLTLTGVTTGNGNGAIPYSVATNTGSSARAATINVSGNFFSVEQRGTGSACVVTPIAFGQTVSGNLSASDCVSPTRNVFGTHYADRYTFSGTIGQRIAITQNSTAIDSYVFLIGPDGAILYEDDEGGGAPDSRIPSFTDLYRLPSTGTYTIEATSYFSGQTGSYTVNLSTPCAVLLPVSQTFTSNGGSGTVAVTAPGSCSRTATSSASWLTVNSGGGNGSGTVSYSVAPNFTGSSRRATLAIGGDFFVVNQSSDILTLAVDDGSFGSPLGYGAGNTGFYVNRLTPVSYPATLSAVSIYFSPGSIQVGEQITILAGANPSGAENINNVTLQTITATVQAVGQFNVVTVPRLTINSGDFVVGFRSSAAFPASFDVTPPALRRSYVSTNGSTFSRIEEFTLFGNFGIRAILATP